MMGEEGVEIGFRPEWVKEGNDSKGVVESIETMGENIYLFCDVGGNKVTIVWREMLDIGDEVAFSITKFRRFKD